MDRRDLLKFSASALIAAMTPLMPGTQGRLRATAYLRTNWSKDPFSFGSYSFVAKGSQQKDRRALAAPIGNSLFFAGEACHPDYNSTVHAAYESGQIAAKQILETDKQNIAIIGAGISGLAAAHMLALTGRKVTVLEARDRIGGRIWTSNDLGTPLDMGASWIHGRRKNPISTLADTLNLKRDVTTDSYIVRGKGGKRLWMIPSWLEEVTEIEHEAGARLDEINIKAYENEESYGGKDVTFRKGYAPILQALSGEYTVRTGAVVSDIALSNGRVAVTTNGGQQAFDAALVTLPLGVLKKGSVAFAPELPKAKQSAIERLGYGVLDKVYLQFETVFWDKRKTWIALVDTGLPRGQFNGWFNIYKYTGAPILMAFNGADTARSLAELSDDEVISRALTALDHGYPG